MAQKYLVIEIAKFHRVLTRSILNEAWVRKFGTPDTYKHKYAPYELYIRKNYGGTLWLIKPDERFKFNSRKYLRDIPVVSSKHMVPYLKKHSSVLKSLKFILLRKLSNRWKKLVAYWHKNADALFAAQVAFIYIALFILTLAIVLSQQPVR